MGSFLRLAKTLSKNQKPSNNTNHIDSDEDREYQKYLESLTDKELEDLIKGKLVQFDNSEMGKAYHLKVNKMTEKELAIEIREKLKIA